MQAGGNPSARGSAGDRERWGFIREHFARRHAARAGPRGDGACFALTDPAANCRAGGQPADALNPVVVSAAFRQTMEPREIRRYRWRLLRMHFQYLCAFAKPRDFDNFRITAGPQSLARRLAGRTCSPSMRAEPVAPVLHPA